MTRTVLNVISDEDLRISVFATLQSRRIWTNHEPLTSIGASRVIKKWRGDIDAMVIQEDVQGFENLLNVIKGGKAKGYPALGNTGIPALILSYNSSNSIEGTDYFEIQTLRTTEGKEAFANLVKKYID